MANGPNIFQMLLVTKTVGLIMFHESVSVRPCVHHICVGLYIASYIINADAMNVSCSIYVILFHVWLRCMARYKSLVGL